MKIQTLQILPQQFQPRDDYVLIDELERSKTTGGLVIPETANKATELAIGRVMAIGKGVYNNVKNNYFPMCLEVGDFALTLRYMGEELKIRAKKYRMVHEHGVWATVEMKDEKSFDIKTIHLRNHSLLVHPREEETSKGGIVFPQGQNTEAGLRIAKVVEVGPGYWHALTGRRIPVGVRPGQNILMTRFAGAIVRVRDIELRVIQENDIACIYEE